MLYGLKSDYEHGQSDIMTQHFENEDYGSKGILVVSTFRFQGEDMYIYILSHLFHNFQLFLVVIHRMLLLCIHQELLLY